MQQVHTDNTSCYVYEHTCSDIGIMSKQFSVPNLRIGPIKL